MNRERPAGRQPRRCQRPGCPGRPVADGLCERHRRPAWHSDSPRRPRLPDEWEERRRAVFERDGYRCALGLPGCQLVATDVHHVGGPNDHRLSKLASACGSCHRRVTGRAGGSAGRGP
ncbi:MAG: hypothetical protein J2P40_07490 [Candidatus Dormibacteraeota bacterium]|nr:hypothetical protein [Candidatus Dormibacteraeota bacterium]MBO0761101.1 hypothetical protein [Candidatus Dormibacteraeota bacterium]